MYKNMSLSQNIGWMMIVAGVSFILTVVGLSLGVPH